MSTNIKTPLTILEIDPHQDPTPEQMQLIACDYVVRVVALMRQRRQRRALVRVTQLNALIQEFPVLVKAYPKLEKFVRFGAYFCSAPKVTATNMLLVGQIAAQLTQKLAGAVQSYVTEMRLNESASAGADYIALADRAPDPKLERLGIGLAALQQLMPRVLEEDRLRKAVEAERYAARTSKNVEAISGDDAFILEQAGKVRIRELAPDESAIVRFSVVLSNSYVSRNAHRALCMDYGMHKVLGEYWLMTDAAMIGVVRKTESGDRGLDEMQAQAESILSARNTSRKRKGLDTWVMVGSAQYSGPHRYYLLLDSRFVAEGSVSVRGWSFFRRPGTDDVRIELSNTQEHV